jgi:hypothetical protein
MLAHHHQLGVVILPIIQPRRAGRLIQCRLAKQFQLRKDAKARSNNGN